MSFVLPPWAQYWPIIIRSDDDAVGKKNLEAFIQFILDLIKANREKFRGNPMAVLNDLLGQIKKYPKSFADVPGFTNPMYQDEFLNEHSKEKWEMMLLKIAAKTPLDDNYKLGWFPSLKCVACEIAFTVAAGALLTIGGPALVAVIVGFGVAPAAAAAIVHIGSVTSLAKVPHMVCKEIRACD